MSPQMFSGWGIRTLASEARTIRQVTTMGQYGAVNALLSKSVLFATDS